MNNQYDIDQIEDLQDNYADYADMQAEHQDYNYFAEAAAESQDQLLAELNDMEAEAYEEQMDCGAMMSAPMVGACMAAAAPAQRRTRQVARTVTHTLQSFTYIIKKQKTDGFWSEDVRSLLEACIDPSSDKGQREVRAAIQNFTLADGITAETVYLTLLAIHILQECYEDDQGEWTLIARKARTWLE